MAIQKDKFFNYGTLLGIIAVAVVTFIDFKNSHRLATDPRARPESFTASDGNQLRVECFRRIDKIERQLQRELDQLHRHVTEQDAKIFHLYEQQLEDAN